MVLDWLAKGKPAGLPDLLARKQFGKAVELAQAQLKTKPRDGRLRLQLADTLIAAGRGREAVSPLRDMADELAAEGFAAKAIAILKRIQKIDPGRIDIERRLASQIAEHTRREATTRATPATARTGVFEFGMEEIGTEEIGFELPGAPARDDAGTPSPAEPHPEPLGDFAPAVPADVPIDLEDDDPARPRAPALFPDFSDEELVAVMGGLRLTSFAPGELIVSEGEPGDSLFLVTTGSVKAWIRNREGRYVFARRLGEGDFFGEISVLTGSPRTATVVAAAPCELLELDRPTLDGITTTYPRVRDVLQRFYEQRIATSADAPASPGAA
jgi:cyclic nucleotide-binding protein/tetratricopeptide repeat protein